MTKLLCLYQIMFQYRVGTYEAMSKITDVDFELWHGDDVKNTKLKNYHGSVSFKHKLLPCWHIPIRTNNGQSTQPFFPFLFCRLIKHNPDVILAEGASSIFSLSIAFLYAKLFNKKIILWSLGKLAQRKYRGLRNIIQKWIRFISKNVNALFVYSTQAENFFIQEGVEPRKIFMAVNVIDSTQKLAAIKKIGPIKKDPGFNVAFVGAINKTKNLELLVDAIGRLSQKYANVKLHIIGEGDYLPTITKYVNFKHLEKNVTFYGRLTDGLNVLLSRFSVLALPGLGGLAIVDGMISSLPIISGSADGTELDLINRENGFVTNNMTVDYMLEKLEFLYKNPKLLDKMGTISFQKITTDLSFENYITIFRNCLSFVINEK